MLLPYASDRPPTNPPLAVVILVLSNFLVYGAVALGLQTRAGSAFVAWFAALSLVPASFRWFAPITYAFLHDHVFHLSANMLFLWVFGASVEDALGWKRFTGLYIAAAIVTGLIQVGMIRLVSDGAATIPIVGSSGAVSAVLGVFAVRFYRSRIRFIGLPFRAPALLLVAAALVAEMSAAIYQIVNGGKHVLAAAHWAHIGGFALGLAWAQLARMFAEGRREYMAIDAKTAMEKGAPLSAVRRWEWVLASRPGDPEAEVELGRAWLAAGDRDQCLIHFQNAISVLISADNSAAAAAIYDEANLVDREVSLPSAQRFAIAASFEEAGEYRKAVSAFQSLIRASPDASEAERALLRLGSIFLHRLEGPKEAADVFNAFLNRYPDSDWRGYAEDQLRTALSR